MKRTQVLLDEPTYQALKDEAHRSGMSVSAVLRKIVRERLLHERARPRLRMEDFTFIASGSNDRPDLEPLSERHDDALAEGSGASW